MRPGVTGLLLAPAMTARCVVAAIGVLVMPTTLYAQPELRGRIIDAAGEPIRGAIVTVTEVGYQIRSDSLGRFVIAGQRGAILKLRFSAPSFRPDTASVLLGRQPSGRDFTLDAEKTATPEENPSANVLRGRVVDGEGTPLSYANVQINFGRRYVADDSGRFQLPMPGDSVTLLVRRIGFEPFERRVGMPDTALRVSLTPIAVQLKGIVVTGASPFRSLDIHGFYGRMKDAERGINRGYFITPEDIERRKPNWITQMVEGFPSIRVCGRASMTCPAGPPAREIILGTRACRMTVYLDNIRIAPPRGGGDDFVNNLALPTHVAAMEVYPRAFEAPPQYPSANGNCGVVLIWSK